MRKAVLWLAVLLWGTVILAGCAKNDAPEEEMVWMANPASVYCEENGGTLVPTQDEEGNEYAFCLLEDETLCEEWEYYRGECPVQNVDEEEINEDEELNDEGEVSSEEEINNEEEVNTEEENLELEPQVWMANPASVYCVEQWGESYNVEDEEWNQIGMCRLPDGIEVDEWENFRANNTEELAE